MVEVRLQSRVRYCCAVCVLGEEEREGGVCVGRVVCGGEGEGGCLGDVMGWRGVGGCVSLSVCVFQGTILVGWYISLQ